MSIIEDLKAILDTINETARKADPMDPRRVVVHVHIHLPDTEVPSPNS